MAFETVSCPACGGNRQALFLNVSDRFSPDPSELFSLQRCLDCTMVYLSPRPAEDESERYYRHPEYLPFSSVSEGASAVERVYRLVRSLNLRWKRRLVERIAGEQSGLASRRLLDVGCGTGEFLGTMKRAGWKVDGLERDEQASAWARRNWGIPVHTGSAASMPKEMNGYDVITMWHVLEHLYDPGKVIDLLRDRLNSGGVLIIALPNIAGVDSRFYREDWIALDVPRHLNHFSSGSLVRSMTTHGFHLHKQYQLPLDAFFNTLMSEQLAARRRKDHVLVVLLRSLRAAAVSLVSLIGGSVLFSHRYGASLVGVFSKTE